MPGLIGYSDKFHKYDKTMLLKMRQLLKYSDSYEDDKVYCDDHICGSRTHLGIINQGIQPFPANNRFYSWLEGEFYNQDELKVKYDVSAENDNELLLNIFCTTKSFDFLRDVDGYYTAVIYDKTQGIVYLITDRYGFKPLYWSLVNGNFIWSSELKGFLGHAEFRIKIDPIAVDQFFDVGYLLENRTWFDGVELMPPAAVLTFNILESSIAKTHYWSWDEIKPLKGPIDEREIAKELGRLFNQAVQKRVRKDEKIGITLSGGLDSRAILAAVPDEYKPLHAFTFGQEGCDDITIAKKAAAVKGAVHHALYIDPRNWLYPRIAGVWKTDGMLNVLHMHGIEYCNHYKSNADIILNGFAGDLVFGGSYLKQRHYLDKIIDSEIAKDVMHAKLKIDIPTEWYLIDKIDPYFINNRVRRFTNTGLIYLSKLLETRQPFFSNKLIEMLYTLPDASRYKSRIYNKILLDHFPEYFMDIPYQKTGCPISYPKSLAEIITFKNRLVGKFKREVGEHGFKYKDLRNYTDYAAWIRQEPAKSFFEKVLSEKNAIYPKYINLSKVRNRLQEHMQNKTNHPDELCLVLTFEIWLQQVFEGQYRKG